MNALEYVTHASFFAASAHRNQVRHGSSEPYFLHVARVARRTAHTMDSIRHGAPEVVVAAAFLHDAIEDCKVTPEQLAEEGFTQGTIGIVQELTDDPTWTREERKLRQAEKMLLASEEACIIKVHDQVDNIVSLDVLLHKTYDECTPNFQLVERSKRYLVGAELVIKTCERRMGVHPTGLWSGTGAAAESLTASIANRGLAPVQSDFSTKSAGVISWAEHLLVYEAYAKKYGNQQSAIRIAERAGFSKAEAEGLIGRPLETWRPWKPRQS